MGLDSIELIMEVENYFSISIPDKEAEKAYTVGRLVDCVANILHVDKYDFRLRDETFLSIKSILQLRADSDVNFLITDKVRDTININDKALIIQLETALDLRLPGIKTAEIDSNTLIGKLKGWWQSSSEIDFEKISWKKYVDMILAFNIEKKAIPHSIQSKYEIYIALMRIIVDKIGVEYSEIGLEKSFTDDLGVD